MISEKKKYGCVSCGLPADIPNYSESKGSHKTALTLAWMEKFILDGLAEGKIKEGEILPTKQVIAKHLGVGEGTVQIAVRALEDKGLVRCKQRIGTIVYLRDENDNEPKMKFKQTTKRDVLVGKMFDIMRARGVGNKLPKIIELSKMFDISTGTVKQALNYLCIKGYLAIKGSGTDLIIRKLPDNADRLTDSYETSILVEKIANIFRDRVRNEYKPGDRLPGTQHYAEEFGVSIKTVYDAMKILNEEGLIKTYKGKYGSVVLGENGEFKQDPNFYRWEKLYAALVNRIKNEYKPGMHLPSIKKTAKEFSAGTKTVRRAYDRLFDEGYVVRGGFRQPPIVAGVSEERAFKWIAVNPGTVSARN